MLYAYAPANYEIQCKLQELGDVQYSGGVARQDTVDSREGNGTDELTSTMSVTLKRNVFEG